MLADLGLLFLRVGFSALLFFGHGWQKLIGFSQIAPTFPDPLHIGGRFSLAMAVFAEVACSLLVGLGAMTRFAAIPPLFTMFVAAGLVHAADPWAKKELAIVYGLAFLTIFLVGPGSFSIDWVFRKRK